MKNNTYDFGLVGLGVMGRNLLLNIADHKFRVIGHDLNTEKVEAMAKEVVHAEHVEATADIEQFVNALNCPRKIMLLVPAGQIVDKVIESLLPLLEVNDILIDGGNSHFTDTNRRQEELGKKNIHFIGAGISGGATGARLGPSIMPGGDKEAYAHIRPIFEAISAKFMGEPCVAYMGRGSSGNYVKMVHNGIEYGLMQLSAEIYDVLKQIGKLSNIELHETFTHWNSNRLQSYIIEISASIFSWEDHLEEGYLIDKVKDKAKQKGTGKWTSQNAMDLGVPIPSIDVAVSMRQLSSLKEDREHAGEVYPKPNIETIGKEKLINLAEAALYFSFITTYAQGMHQLSVASAEYEYDLDISAIARIWRNGCIIRARLLDDISNAFGENNALKNLVLDPSFIEKINSTVPAARTLIGIAVKNGIPLPGISNALSYFDAFTSKSLPLNLIQAQRDYFGSHTYERIDRDGIYHSKWGQ